MARTSWVSPVPTMVDQCAVESLLIGADLEFLDAFPKKLILDTGCLPIRRYRGMALVVPPPGSSGAKAVRKLQQISDSRLLAIHQYGIDLFFQYWEGGSPGTAPPLWTRLRGGPSFINSGIF